VSKALERHRKIPIEYSLLSIAWVILSCMFKSDIAVECPDLKPFLEGYKIF